MGSHGGLSVTVEQGTARRSVFPGFAELDEDPRAVVLRLADHRRTRGLTQTEVAARMGTSQSAVARLEAGRGDARLSTLQRYAAALDHTVRFGVAPATPVDDGGAP
jgi:DNA-binding XRE family transcriptional regulator